MENKQTDWDLYYSTRKKHLTLPRRVTLSNILSYMKKYVGVIESAVELGGGDSCFMKYILDKNQNLKYYIVDNNKVAINKISSEYSNNNNIVPVYADILSTQLSFNADFVLSVGLIEHFNIENTAKCIKYHFDSVKKGGKILITFPTPTLLYKIIRYSAEILNIWMFPDERPLLKDEVFNEIYKYGNILDYKTTYLIGLTQIIVIAQKN
ncbi:MAG: class I SAM-dependent methyltransferase [Deltaproteobacteria bacterium]|nr:class I SAM-dependent methyltransferase [Deltaproteobacteria bacterium]